MELTQKKGELRVITKDRDAIVPQPLDPVTPEATQSLDYAIF